MRTESVRLLRTLEHPCGYFKGRSAQNLVIDPLATELPRLYDFALASAARADTCIAPIAAAAAPA